MASARLQEVLTLPRSGAHTGKELDATEHHDQERLLV